MDRYRTNSSDSPTRGSPDTFTQGSFSPIDRSHGSPSRPSTNGRSRPATSEKVVYGLNLGMLRKWQKDKKEELLSSEEAKQEIAVSKVRGFLDAVGCVVRIQSWWRMLKPYHAFRALKRAQRELKALYYRALRLYWKSERLYRVQIFGKFFIGWREEARTSKKLKSLITQFFKICIQRLRLTPQACMAFFNPGEWSSAIAKEDMLKIRRLMLEKLFSGWRSETVFLRMVRYKASQILSRMVRRTKGPLWVKESTLVCFHMWFRYIQVKKAYRLDLPDPRYNNPMLPQWTKLMKDITVNRIKRKRTREVGFHLTTLRAFKNWSRLMAVDRTKPVTPLAVAIMHYNTVLMNKILTNWHELIRERGKLMRFRTRIFHVWKQWAPKHRQMRIFNDKAQELIRLKLVQRAYGVMIKLCFNVIGMRTEKIKELRRNFCDRRVVICAYALLHKDSHVMMVDCWRRLYFYWKSRRNWKSVTWHYTYEWHAHKMKVIFAAWKSLTQPHTRPPVNTGHTSNAGHAHSKHPPSAGQHHAKTSSTAASSATNSNRSHNPYISETDTENESEPATPRGIMSRADSSRSVDSVSTLNSEEPSALMFSTGRPANLEHALHLDGSSLPSSLPGSAVNSARDDSSTGSGTSPHKTRRRSSARVKVNFNASYNPRGLIASKEIYYEKLVRDFVPKGLSIVQKGLEGKLGTKLSHLQFRTFCYALSRSYAQLSAKLRSHNVNNSSSVVEKSVLQDAENIGESSTFLTGVSAPNKLATPVFTVANPASLTTDAQVYAHMPTPQALNSASLASTSTGAVGSLVDNNTTTATESQLSKELHYPVQLYFNRTLQDQLQLAIDQVDMNAVLQAVSEGAVIESQHIKQIGLHIGDMYMPMLTLLLTNSVQFFADRVIKQDSQQLLMEIQNPINAYLMGSQIERWNRGEITYRESMHITENLPTQRYLSGEFASYYLMRFVILKNIDLRAKQLLHLCVMLPESRSVDQEVPEVLKRQKLAKLYRLRKSLTEMIGGDDSFEETYLHAVSTIPPLVRPANRPVTPPYAKNGNTTGKDIYTVLREFTLLTGKLTMEARSLRQPLMERDERLIANGFLRGARADFLALRQSCLSDKQRAEIAEKQAKKDEKDRRVAEKLKAKERKKREKRLGIAGSGKDKKKGKKGGKTTAELNFDLLDNGGETSEEEGYNSNADTHGLHGELNQLQFLEDGLHNMGEESDLRQENDFLTRVANFKHAVYLEVFQRLNWKEQLSTRESVQHGMVASMRGTIKRVLDVLQADKTINKIDFAQARQKFKGIGQFLVNHALANVACRRSPTWYVLPRDYWSFRVVRDRVNTEIALTDAAVSGIRSQLGSNHSSHYDINNDIAKYQKFLKQTRKEILTIAEKRAAKHGVDENERAPFVTSVKKCDVRIKGAEKAIEVIKDKLRRAEVQVAAGNATGAAEIFVPPPVEAEDEKAKKKGKKKEPEAPAVVYNFKAVYALIDAANQEIESLKAVVAEQSLKKKEGENSVRMYDWQCQRTSRMLRDLAEARFQTMVDVQLIAVREAKRLEKTEEWQDLQLTRYKGMKRYARQLTDFLQGPIVDRGNQLAKEAEQRRVSEIMSRSPASAKESSKETGAKKRGTLASFSEDIREGFSPNASFLREIDPDRPSTTTMGDLLSGGFLDEESVANSNYSYDDEEENDPIALMLAERDKAQGIVTGAEEVNAEAVDTNTDTRTSSQIAVDKEIELAHLNSVENRMKRDAELKLLAEEQAREMATQDLRIRVFEDYWSAMPQNAERVQRKKNKEKEEEDSLRSEESSVVAEISNEYLNRSQRIWKSIGTQYWRTKEEVVRDLVQKGEDVSNVHLKIRAIDPLDEDLNEPPPVAIMTGNNDDEGNSMVPAVMHARDVNLLHSTDLALWKSTVHEDHQMMLSVSMKDINNEESLHHHHKDESHLHKQHSDSSLSHAPSTNVSRQPSMTRQPSTVSRQPSVMSDHHHGVPATGPPKALAQAKPDPFALVARDEHLRFVDPRYAKLANSSEGDDLSTVGSFDAEPDALSLHAELGGLVKHALHAAQAHLPTLVEGERFAADQESGMTRSIGYAEGEEEEEEEEQFEDFRTASASFLKFNESLGIAPGTPSLEESGATFAKWDQIFDKLNDTIVGALEDAFGDDGSAASEPSVLSNSGKHATVKEKRKRRGTLVRDPSEQKIDLDALSSAIGGIMIDPHNITGSAAGSRSSSVASPMKLVSENSLVGALMNSGASLVSSAGSDQASVIAELPVRSGVYAPEGKSSTPTIREKSVSFIDKSSSGAKSGAKGKKDRARASFAGASPIRAAQKAAAAAVGVEADGSESDTSVTASTPNTRPSSSVSVTAKGRKSSIVASPSSEKKQDARKSVVSPAARMTRVNSMVSPKQSPSPLNRRRSEANMKAGKGAIKASAENTAAEAETDAAISRPDSAADRNVPPSPLGTPSRKGRVTINTSSKSSTPNTTKRVRTPSAAGAAGSPMLSTSRKSILKPPASGQNSRSATPTVRKAIEESDERSVASSHSQPPTLDIPPSRGNISSPGRVKMEFSDDLLPSGRDPLEEDDVTSEISMDVYHNERGAVAIIPRVPGVYFSGDSRDSPLTPNMSISGSNSGRSSPHMPAPFERSDTFKASVEKLMESVNLEPQMPELYLPEKDMRQAIFGGEIDTGAAGLNAFLQSFAVDETPVVKTPKRPKPVVVKDLGYVAVPEGGEWVLKPSTLGPPLPYSPKMAVITPKASDVSHKGGIYQPSTQPLALPKSAQHSFSLDGTGIISPKQADALSSVKVPALSPNSNRRLAHKLGLADVAVSEQIPTSSAHTFDFPPRSSTTAPTTAPTTAEPHASLLSMVQEFYTEKEIEEKRIAQLEEKARISYFPANFRQNKQRTQEDNGLGGGTWESEDEHYASDGNNSEHSASNFHSNVTSQGNSMKYVNAPRSRRASTKNSSEYSEAEIHAAVAAAEGNPPSASFAGTRTSFTSIPASSSKVTASDGKFGSSKHNAKPGEMFEAGVAAGTQSNNHSRKPSTDSTPGATPTSRLSLKMQHMLNRRGSYNPTEIRLELLASIHDDQAADNQLDAEVNNAVREVKKYLHDREEEAHRVHPTGKLRTKESLAAHYRDAVSQQANPHKQLSVTQALQHAQEAAALATMQSHGRHSPTVDMQHAGPYPQEGFFPHGEQLHSDQPYNAQHALTYNTQAHAEERRDSGDLLLTEQNPDFYAPQHQLLQRAGTPEFWVDVAKISPSHSKANSVGPSDPGHAFAMQASHQQDDNMSEQSGGFSGTSDGVDRPRVMFADQLQQHSAQHAPYTQYTQYVQHAPVNAYEYGQEGVRGFNNQFAAPSEYHHTHSKHISHSKLKMSVAAVKLAHPVSDVVDPKAQGQYNLYRPRTPLRSASPPFARDARSDKGGNKTGKHQQEVGKKGLVHSHSDGLLLGANAMITGTKLNLSATTTQLPRHGDSDEQSTGGESVHSTLSPILFHLSAPKPSSPPAHLLPVPYFSANIESDSVGNNSESNLSALWKLDPQNTNANNTGSNSSTNSVIVEGRAVTPALHRTNTAGSFNKDFNLTVSNIPSNNDSGLNSHMDTSPPSPVNKNKMHFALPAASIVHTPSEDDIRLAYHLEHSMDSSNEQKDFRASASAAKIISEIAGEHYYSGMGVHTEVGTCNNSITGGSQELHSEHPHDAIDAVHAVAEVQDLLLQGGTLEVNDNSQVGIKNTSFSAKAANTAKFMSKQPEAVHSRPLTPSMSPCASPLASPHRNKKVATKTKNLLFSPDSIDNQSYGSQSTFSFGLIGTESDVLNNTQPNQPMSSQSLKLPKVSSASQKEAKETKEAIPSNIITSARRLHEATAVDSLIVTPQSMPGLNKINNMIVQKQGSLKPVGPVSKTVKKKQPVFLKALSTEAFTGGSVASDLDSVNSHHDSMKVPVPVSRVDFVVNHSVSSEASAMRHNMQAAYDAQRAAQDEADIEKELRQMLHKQHNEDAAEAYRQAYYKQNKSHLANAGVILRDEVDLQGKDAPRQVPFNAGSINRGSNTSVGAVTAGLTTVQRLQLSSSVGGGGFVGRGQGVLHKVKGSSVALSHSTSALPPLDSNALMSVETKFSDPSTKAVKMNASSNKKKNTKFDATDEILQKRQVLAALLNYTTAETADLDRPLGGETYVTGTKSSKTKIATDTLHVSTSAKLFSAPVVGAAKKEPKRHPIANNASAHRSTSNSPSFDVYNVASRKGSVDSISSIGSGHSNPGPLQSIHAPAVEINSHIQSHSGTTRKF